MTRRNLLIAAGVLGANPLSGAPAQAASSPRDRFFLGVPEWPGLRTGILLMRDRPGKDPLVREVNERQVFQSGDRFRLRVQTNFDAELLVLALTPGGGAEVLVREGSRRFDLHFVPGKDWFRFDEVSGIERLFAIAGRRKLTPPKTIAPRDLDRFLAAISADQPEWFDEAGLPNAGDAAGSYVVAPFQSDDEYLVRPIELVHRPVKRS
jgi:hypothetical protein